MILLIVAAVALLAAVYLQGRALGRAQGRLENVQTISFEAGRKLGYTEAAAELGQGSGAAPNVTALHRGPGDA